MNPVPPMTRILMLNLQNNRVSWDSRYADSMLGLDPRAARAAWTVFLVALMVATAYAIRETLAVLMIALLFAYLLMPLLGIVHRFTPRRISPTVALAIVYLTLLGIIIALGLTV